MSEVRRMLWRWRRPANAAGPKYPIHLRQREGQHPRHPLPLLRFRSLESPSIQLDNEASSLKRAELLPVHLLYLFVCESIKKRHQASAISSFQTGIA